MTTSRTAEELALEVRRGSREAFGELVERFQEPLYNFLSLRVRNAADAEELTQEAFLRAWSRIATYDSGWRFRTWLFAVARNLAVSHHRSAGLRTAGDVPLESLGGGEDPTFDLADAELRGRIWSLASQLLSEDQHAALWLRYAEDLSPLEIARILGRRPSTVRVLLFRARERLAAHLDPAEDRPPAKELTRLVPGDAR